MSNKDKPALKIIQVDTATHGAIKSLAAQEGKSMPETTIELIKLGLVAKSNKQGNE